MNDITALMATMKAEDISPERMEWLKKLADMEYCASNPGHWLMNLKETNYLAALALQFLENNLALVEALEARDKQIARLEKKLSDRKRMNQEMATAMLKPVADESRTVKLPDPLMPAQHNSGELFMTPDNVIHGGYLNRDDVLRNLRAAGIQVIEGEGQ